MTLLFSQDKEFQNSPLGHNILRDWAIPEKAASSLIRNFRPLLHGGINSVLRTGPRGRIVGSIMTDTAESNLGDQTNGTIRSMRESSSHPPSSKTDKGATPTALRRHLLPPISGSP